MNDEPNSSADPSEVPAASPDTASETPQPSPPKLKIGSQRPGSKRVEAVARNVMAERGPKQKVEVPNTRAELPPEWEQEVADALGDFSLNELVDTAGHATKAVEHDPEAPRTGRVIKVHNQDVFVDLGGRDQGVVSLTQFKEPPQPGAVVNVLVSGFNQEEGMFQLRLPGATMEAGDWNTVTEGALIDVRISGSNKGGLECEVGKLRGFIPAGQVSVYRVENFEEFVGQTMTCLITEVNAERRRLVLSRRAVIEKEKAESKERMMAELAEGDVREGTVRSLMDFGAFVDLGGVDGLIHISRLAWSRVKHPSEVLSVGQPVKVKVVSIDHDTGKIGLSLRDLAGDPWLGATLKYKQGDVIRGPVVRVLDKVGAFVQLEPGIDGMVHISEIAHSRVFRVTDFLKEDQEVEAKILSIDPEQKRVSLSIKAQLAKPEPVKKEAEIADEPDTPPLPLPPQPKKLKGGVGKKSGGAQFGLKW
jgi:small subunit ribosomal protein S1